MRNRVIASLRSADDDSIRTAAQNISQNIVYEHPTLSELATALVALVNPSSAAETKDRLRHIADMIHKFSADIPSPNYNLASSSGPITVLLTGSTGNVGSHILVALLAEPRVEKVYTLSRPASQGEDRQRAAFVERGLPEVLLDTGKLVSFVGDPNQPELGLKHEDFVEVSPPPLDFIPPLTFDEDTTIVDACHSQCLASRLQPVALVFRKPNLRHPEAR